MAATLVSSQVKTKPIFQKDRSSAAAIVTKKPKPPATATVPAVDEGFVDWGYLRVNRPETVSALVEMVRKGERDLVTLGGLTTQDRLKDYASGGYRPSPKPSEPSGGATRSGILSRPGASTVLTRPNPGIASTLKTPPTSSVVKLLIPLDVSPGKVDFGSVVDGQSVRKVVYLRNAPAGVAKASLDPKSPFKILRIDVLEGRYTLQRAGAWMGSLINTYGPESAGIPSNLGGPGASSAVGRPRLNSAVIGRLNQGSGASKTSPFALKAESAAVSAALKGRREATTAPFEVDAPEGASVRVTLEFRPKFNLFGGDFVGRHEANLELACGSQTANVKLNAFFEGVNLGVITIPADREYTLFASPKQEKHPSGGNMVTAEQNFRFGFKLTFLNPKADSPVHIFPVDLPPGVTLQESSPGVAKNGRTEGYVGFNARFWGDDRGAQYGMGQEILLRITSDRSDRYLSLTLNLLPAMRAYSVRGSLDNVFYDIKMTCFQDGFIDAEFDYHTSNAWPTDGEFKFSIDGVEMVHYTSIWMTGDNRMKSTGKPRFKSDRLAAEWERFVQKPGTFWIKVTEKFRL